MIRRVLGSRSGHAAGDETVLHPGEYRSIAAYIPGNLQQPFLASAAHLFALATLELAITGDIPPEEKHESGQEAIVLARKALEIYTPTQLFGTQSFEKAANGTHLAGCQITSTNFSATGPLKSTAKWQPSLVQCTVVYR